MGAILSQALPFIASTASNLLKGGSSGGSGSLASLLGGLASSQRIPGQTQAGAYTPPSGGFGTYNYIPTGATQIDPQLIQMLLGGASSAGDTSSVLQQYNNPLLQAGMNNPYGGGFQSGVNSASGFNSNALSSIQQMLLQGTQNSGYAPGSLGYQSYGATTSPMGIANNGALMSDYLWHQAQDNQYTPDYINNTANVGNTAMAGGANLAGTAGDALSGASNIVGQLSNNPFLQQAQTGANQAGAMLGQTGQNQYGLGQTFTGTAAQGLPAASQILNTAFDPQQALYDQTLNKTQDQIGSMLARTGTTDSGTGAKFAGDTLRDFNIDWQNNQLARQTQGLSAFNSGMTSTGNNLGTGTNLQATGAGNVASGASMPATTYQGLGDMQLGNYSQLSNILGSTGGAMTSGANLGYNGAGAGYNATLNSLTNLQPFAANYGAAGTGIQNTLSNMGSLGSTIGNLGTADMNFLAAPYNTANTQTGNQNTSLSNYLGNQTAGGSINNQSITQLMNYLNSVMTGSNNAASAARGAQTGTTGQNAAASAGTSGLIQSGFDALGKIDWSKVF